LLVGYSGYETGREASRWPQVFSLLKSSQVIEGIAGMLGQARTGEDVSLVDGLIHCGSPCSHHTAHPCPPPRACQETSLARRSLREAGVSKHPIISLAVSEHNNNAAACSNMGRPCPALLWLVEDGDAAEVLYVPSAT